MPNKQDQDGTIEDLKSRARTAGWKHTIESITSLKIPDDPGGPCPHCNGDDRFFAHTDFEESGGVGCRQCKPSTGDGIATIAWIQGIKNGEAAAKIAEFFGIEFGTKPVSEEDRALRDKLYRFLIDRLGLNEKHKADLKSRGLSDTIGYASLPKKSRLLCVQIQQNLSSYTPTDIVNRVPGFTWSGNQLRLTQESGLLIPVYHNDGRIAALKVRTDKETKAGRYFYVSGGKKNFQAHLPNGKALKQKADHAVHVSQTSRLLPDNTQIRITEGELKANVATELTQILTIGVPGANSWKKSIPIVKSRGTFNRVLVAFDSDWRTNDGVAKAIYGLATELKAEGLTPAVEIWDEKTKGIDDLLNAGQKPHVLEGDELDNWLHKELKTLSLPADQRESHQLQLELEAGKLTEDEKIARLREIVLDPKTEQGRTQEGTARRFARNYKNKVRFCPPWNKWMVYDSRRWSDSEVETSVTEMVSDENRKLYDWTCKTDEEAEMLKSFSTSQQTKDGILGTKKFASELTEIRVQPDTFDSGTHLNNVQNGTLDLKTSTLKNHEPDDLITTLLPVNYKPDVECPRFIKFMLSIFGGDQEMVDFIQRWLGYCLTGDTSEQVMAIFWGAGSNGKSTLIDVIQEILGIDLAIKAEKSVIMKRRNDGHPTAMMDLAGKRFVYCSEGNDDDQFDEAMVKELTGDGRIRGRRMRENTWEYVPTHKLIFCTNNRPTIKGTDDGIWRRILLIPFTQKFWNPATGETGPEHLKRDNTLPAQLRAEMDGIYAWMVKGCRKWQEIGLAAPASVMQATKEYRESEDSIGQFLEERCHVGGLFNDKRVKASSLYAAYKKWTEERSDQPLNQTAFGKQMKVKGFEKKKVSVFWYQGLMLRDELNEPVDYEPEPSGIDDGNAFSNEGF
jgi:putative DNA primase/helicase